MNSVLSEWITECKRKSTRKLTRNTIKQNSSIRAHNYSTCSQKRHTTTTHVRQTPTWVCCLIHGLRKIVCFVTLVDVTFVDICVWLQ